MRKERIEANTKLSNYKKSFTTLKGQEPMNPRERIKLIPESFKEGDWQDPILYAYFAVNYFDEECFNEILRRAQNFRNFDNLR